MLIIRLVVLQVAEYLCFAEHAVEGVASREECRFLGGFKFDRQGLDLSTSWQRIRRNGGFQDESKLEWTNAKLLLDCKSISKRIVETNNWQPFSTCVRQSRRSKR